MSAQDVDRFIAEAPEQARPGLQALRDRLEAELPDATVRISYGVPIYELGRQVIGFGYAKGRTSLYVMSPPLVQELAQTAEAAGATTSGGTIGVPHGTDFPDDLLELVVARRLAELGIARDTVLVRNVNHPDAPPRAVDGAKYQAMADAVRQVLPRTAPGLTAAELVAAVLPLLPQDHFPGGAAAGWWAKTAQLDLEAQGVVMRERSKPLRFHLATPDGPRATP